MKKNLHLIISQIVVLLAFLFFIIGYREIAIIVFCFGFALSLFPAKTFFIGCNEKYKSNWDFANKATLMFIITLLISFDITKFISSENLQYAPYWLIVAIGSFIHNNFYYAPIVFSGGSNEPVKVRFFKIFYFILLTEYSFFLFIIV